MVVWGGGGGTEEEMEDGWEDVCLAYQNLREVFDAEKEAESRWVSKKTKREENEREKNRLLSFFSFLLPSSLTNTPSYPSPLPPPSPHSPLDTDSLDMLPSSLKMTQNHPGIPLEEEEDWRLGGGGGGVPGSRKRKESLSDDLLGLQVGTKRRKTDPVLLLPPCSSSSCSSSSTSPPPSPPPSSVLSSSPPSRARMTSAYF